MAVLNLRDVAFGYGGRPLVEQANLRIEKGERIALVGRNGTGKSTLMRLIAGEIAAEAGLIERSAGLKVARQIQEVPRDLAGSNWDVVAGGLGELAPAVFAHHRAHLTTSASDHGQLTSAVEITIDPEQAWVCEHQVDQILSRLELDPLAAFEKLSAGMKRRVLLARALVNDPEILLLDEPTNHLDLEAIRWLEDFLPRFAGTLIFVTHDRMFLSKLATRIVEIDRGRLFDWTCDYPTFLQRKEEALAVEDRQQALFDKKLAQEEAWLRQGVKARRTRNEGRVRALEQLRRERSDRREKIGTAQVELHQDAERSGNLVLQTQKIGYSTPEKPIVQELSTVILRGDKVGIIGPNGCGKTTLLRLLLGELTPMEGNVRQGTQLDVAYFDQLRAQLDEEQTVIENVAHGQDQLQINGRSRHIISYLEDFLFTPERARTLVRFLSGGERNRLLLARLFSRPSNVLVLDEPTNDLDMETLELLECVLGEYPGTILLVSHDRAFLNHIVTQTLVFEGDGVVKEYAGGYDDWVRQRAAAVTPVVAATPTVAASARKSSATNRPKSLSFKEQRELEQLPKQIEDWEAEQEAIHQAMSAPGYYQQESDTLAQTTQRLEALHEQLSTAYARWEALEAIAANSR
ncbi:ATP-binding cassette domain-containing protein [bacterium]|nr:ATP-binding cassette domain-containing protein [bacterium]